MSPSDRARKYPPYKNIKMVQVQHPSCNIENAILQIVWANGHQPGAQVYRSKGISKLYIVQVLSEYLNQVKVAYSPEYWFGGSCSCMSGGWTKRWLLLMMSGRYQDGVHGIVVCRSIPLQCTGK